MRGMPEKDSPSGNGTEFFPGEPYGETDPAITLARAVARDMHGPLLAIINYAWLLNDRYAGILDRSAERHLYYILESARALELVAEGLEASADTETDFTFSDSVELESLLKNIEGSVSGFLSSRGLTLTCDALPEVQGRRGSLAPLLRSTVLLVAAHAPSSAVCVHVSVTTRPGEWIITALPQGSGQPGGWDGSVRNLWTLLSENGKIPAAGTALALCEKLAAKNGGTVWRAGTGRGAGIAFSLPRPDDFGEGPVAS